jgi:hypothetical protein
VLEDSISYFRVGFVVHFQDKVSALAEWPHQRADDRRGEFFHDRHDDCVSELSISLGVGNRNFEVRRVAHQPTAFSRRQTARILAGTLGDQDLGTILVITSTERSRHVLAGKQSKTEAISCRFVLRGIVLEVLPEVIGERVFRRGVPIEDSFEFWSMLGEIGKLEVAPRFETNKENALTMLGHHALRINDAVIDRVAKFLGKRTVDDLESATPVMPLQVLHVFQDESGRLMKADDSSEVEEEISLFFVLEAVLAPEAKLLRDAGEAEWLAGKACAEDVELRDVGNRHVVYVAVRFLAEIGLVGELGVLVPVGGEHALAACALESESETSYSAEEINEPKSLSVFCYTVLWRILVR